MLKIVLSASQSRNKTVVECMLASESVCVCVTQVRETQARLRHHLNRKQMLEGTLITATMLLFRHSAIIPAWLCCY